MYFTVGAHPAFNVPILPDTKREDYHLIFSGQKELTYHLLDTRYGTAIPEKSYTLALENGSCQIAEGMFDKDALIFDDGQITKAGIALPDGTPYVEISCEGFPNFGIWSAGDAPFVCLEPWYGLCAPDGYKGELKDRPGIQKLEAWGTWEKSYSIRIE